MRKTKIMLVALMMMMMSILTFSFASDLETYGIIAGNDQGELNLDQEFTRAEALVVLSRLYGNEDEVEKYVFKSDLIDVQESNWFSKYVYYGIDAKWIGAEDYTNGFRPNEAISTRVLLDWVTKCLGYEVTSEELVGKSFELKLIENESADMAKNLIRKEAFEIIENALKASLKDGSGSLGASLKLFVDEVVVENNNKIVKTYSVDIDKVYVEFSEKFVGSAADIVLNNGLDSSVLIERIEISDKTVIAHTKSELEKGKLYNISYNGSDARLAGVAKDTVKPVLSSVSALNQKIIRVTFVGIDLDRETMTPEYMSFDTNMTIEDVQFNEKEMEKNPGYTIIDLQVSNGVVNTANKIVFTGVKDYSGNALDLNKVNTVFASKEDQKPKVKEIKVVDDKLVKVVFEAGVMLSEDSVLNTTNYVFDKDVVVESVDISKNELTGEKEILLNINTSTNVEIYKLEIKNIEDIHSNKMDNKSSAFAGLGLKYNVVTGAYSINDGKGVKITFKYDMDATALMKDYYSINNAINVESVNHFVNIDGTIDSKSIVLNISQTQSKKAFEVKVSDEIKSKSGLLLEQDKTMTFAGSDGDTKKPELVLARTITSNIIELEFNEEVDQVTATNIENYSLDNELGHPTYGVMKYGDDKKVILYFSPTKAGKAFAISIKNVADDSDAKNIIIDNTKGTFAGRD